MSSPDPRQVPHAPTPKGTNLGEDSQIERAERPSAWPPPPPEPGNKGGTPGVKNSSEDD